MNALEILKRVNQILDAMNYKPDRMVVIARDVIGKGYIISFTANGVAFPYVTISSQFFEEITIPIQASWYDAQFEKWTVSDDE